MNTSTAIRLSLADDVAVARMPILSGALLADYGVTAKSNIPAGHKIALRNIRATEPIRKYDQVIGFASKAIAAGDHVHTENLEFAHFIRPRDIASHLRNTTLRPEGQRATFEGYVREDGRVATRNYVGIVSTVNCSSTVVRRIAAHFTPEVMAAYPNVDGVVPIAHNSGCGLADAGEPLDLLRRVLKGYASHPNFAATLILGLGCETIGTESLLDPSAMDGNIRAANIQDTGGTRKSIEDGIATVYQLLGKANLAQRTSVPASAISLGLQCGGSDGYSGISANPALGAAVDILVSHGGTAILSETPEIYGAEHLITSRCATPEVAEKLLTRIKWWESYIANNSGSMNNNPQPGNKAGGLTTILEKSLGAISKAGSTNFVEYYDYAEPVTARGLVFMDSPGFDPVSATGQVAGGANVLGFTTGRGSVFGCKPTPCIKLAASSELYNRMREDMDIDCGSILDGRKTVKEMGEEIFQTILDVASGRLTCSEQFGFGDDEFQPWILGAIV